MDLENRVALIYKASTEIGKHFYLKTLNLRTQISLFLQLKPESSGKDLESLVVTLDEVFTEAENHGFLGIIFSFKDVTHFGDLGMSVIMAHAINLEAKGGQIIFCNVDTKIRQVMTILNLDETIEIYDTEEELIANNLS
jgi:anti-anti-sigma factor